MEVSPAAKVGMVVILAMIMVGLIMSQLSYWKKREVGVPYYIVFKNVSGLQIGSPVRKAGVDIGKVTKIEIISVDDNDKANVDKVRVTIYVYNRKEILTQNSLYTISSTFMGDKWLEILPRQGDVLKEGGQVDGKSPVTLDDLIVQSEATLSDLRKAVDNLNGLIGDEKVKKDIKDSVANFKAISGNLKSASYKINDTVAQLGNRLVAVGDRAEKIMQNVDVEIKGIGGDVRGFTKTLKKMAVTNEKTIDGIVKNLGETANNLNISMKAIKDLVTNDKFSSSILKTLTNIEKASEDVEGIASDVRSITSDPQIREDLKATIHQARETVEGAKDLIKRVRASLGISGGDGLKLMELDTSMEWNTESGRSSGNANLWLLPKAKNTMKMGVEDIGNRNLVNFQYGRTMKSIRPRIGVVRSAAGLGADAFIGKGFELNLDAYDPSNVKMDILGRVYMGNDFYLMGGVRDAFDSKQGVIGVGKKF